ncbi:NlpC/P60 family protein [Streptomyces sp. NPDC047085]|uniref:C40 family peptidase n=1 Tax=Streptomyces sp. NPDC047085 TaxID=3155140 RepID=UPI0033FA2F31
MGPERDEVRQRIDSLYNQAENATGMYNATRAMAVATRGRGVPLAKRPGRPSDPALDAVARQWFDAARTKLGPTMPAVLPADRLPENSARPARTGNRSDDGRPGTGRELPAGGLPALPAGSTGRGGGRAVAELTAGDSPAEPSAQSPLALKAGTTSLPSTAPAELPPGRPAELPVGRSMELPGMYAELPAVDAVQPADSGRAEPLGLTAPAPLGTGASGTAMLPVNAPQRPSLSDAKATNRRKLAAAQDLLSRYAAQLSTPFPAAALTAPTQDTWATPAPESIPVPGPESIPAPTPIPVAAPTPVPEPDPLTDTGSFALTPAPSPLTPAAKAIDFARAQIGKPCVWGATGPDSYDCSSLTQGAWKAAGVTLPRAAHQQALAGTPITLAGIQPGDLVLFFDDDRHVGLYVGGGMMVHAPGPGSSIREESIYGAGEQAIHRVIRPA